MIYITGLYDAVKENERMIYKLASNFSNERKEDLYQVGVIGLISAYNNYDKSYGTKFSTYAHTYILGEMKKYIREDNGVKISRDIIYLSSRLDRLIELLCQKYNRMPTTKELSDYLEVSEWKIIEALNIKGCVNSLDEPINSEGKDITLSDIIPSNAVSDNTLVNELIDKLGCEERRIIKLRYFEDKNQSEVAYILGYSQAKISRIEKNALSKLRSYYD